MHTQEQQHYGCKCINSKYRYRAQWFMRCCLAGIHQPHSGGGNTIPVTKARKPPPAWAGQRARQQRFPKGTSRPRMHGTNFVKLAWLCIVFAFLEVTSKSRSFQICRSHRSFDAGFRSNYSESRAELAMPTVLLVHLPRPSPSFRLHRFD